MREFPGGGRSRRLDHLLESVSSGWLNVMLHHEWLGVPDQANGSAGAVRPEFLAAIDERGWRRPQSGDEVVRQRRVVMRDTREGAAGYNFGLIGLRSGVQELALVG